MKKTMFFLFLLMLIPFVRGAAQTATCQLPKPQNLSISLSPTNNDAKITWNKLPNAVGYELKVFKVSNNSLVDSSIISQPTTGTRVTKVVTGLQSGETYKLIVRGKCSNGSFGKEASRYFTTNIIIITDVVMMNVPNTSTNKFRKDMPWLDSNGNKQKYVIKITDSNIPNSPQYLGISQKNIDEINLFPKIIVGGVNKQFNLPTTVLGHTADIKINNTDLIRISVSGVNFNIDNQSTYTVEVYEVP